MVSEANHEEDEVDPSLEVDPLLEPGQSQQYRSVVMLLMYYTQYVFKAMYACIELAREASYRRRSSWQRLKRLLRFLKREPEWAYHSYGCLQ